MLQKDVARFLGVTKTLIVHWEKQHYDLGASGFYQKIIEFLGSAVTVAGFSAKHRYAGCFSVSSGSC